MNYSLLDVLHESLPDLRNKRLKPVTVAVIDSGIDSSHEVLRSRVCAAWEFVEENGSIVKRVLPPKSNNDEAGHGTAVASIIAKIAPNARILDFKVLNANFAGTGKVMMAGLQAAVESDAKIINMSLACLAKYRNELSLLLEDACRKHKIIIASKRNTVLQGDQGFPAELASCISVENHSYENNPYFIEYIDEQPIEFAAHGENVLAAQNGGGFYRLTGTSFATPTVSGNVALLLGRYPELELFEIKSVLKHHSLQDDYRKTAALNPLEISNRMVPQTQGGKCSTYLCPECRRRIRVHNAFSLIRCPKCKLVFSLFSDINKDLFNFMTRQIFLNLSPIHTYHDVLHTKEVLFNTSMFVQNYPHLSRRKVKCLLTAALFHDYGYCIQYENNEGAAADYAAEILPEYGYSEGEIGSIRSLIMTTGAGVRPGNLLEKILCDADLGHIGQDIYFEKSKLLRQERENFGKKSSTEDWLKEEISFLCSHHFYQPWLEQERKDVRADHVAILKRKLKAAIRKNTIS